MWLLSSVLQISFQNFPKLSGSVLHSAYLNSWYNKESIVEVERSELHIIEGKSPLMPFYISYITAIWIPYIVAFPL